MSVHYRRAATGETACQWLDGTLWHPGIGASPDTYTIHPAATTCYRCAEVLVAIVSTPPSETLDDR